MSGKRHTEEFKIEAVKQVTDRGYKIVKVAERIEVSVKSPGDWVKKYGDFGSRHQTITSQQEELRRLKAGLRFTFIRTHAGWRCLTLVVDLLSR